MKLYEFNEKLKNCKRSDEVLKLIYLIKDFKVEGLYDGDPRINQYWRIYYQLKKFEK